MDPFSSPRSFQVWLFTVTHRTLLLRSVKDTNNATRIDILFKQVRHLYIPSQFNGLDVVEGEFLGVPENLRASLKVGEKIYRMTSPAFDGWIVATTCAWHEDNGDYGDDSYFDVPRVVW
jgi:hypothetical protein